MDGYWIANKLIPEHYAKYFANLICSYDKHFMQHGDEQCPRSMYGYANSVSEVLLFMLLEKVQNICGKQLVPTYSYSRIYCNGETLQKHRDRESCEYSLTLNLDSDTVWPFHVENLQSKQFTSVHMSPGDGVVYMGCEVEHFREPFNGNRCVQVFLHYVDAGGPYCSTFKYDGRNLRKPLCNMQCNITALQSILSQEVCESIVNTYQSYDSFVKEKVLELSKMHCFDDLVFQGTEKIIQHMQDATLWEHQHLYDSGYTLHLLEHGETKLFVESAVDMSYSGWRISSIVMALTDGIEVVFPQQNKRFAVQKGCAIVFAPHYPHKFILTEEKGVIVKSFMMIPETH